MKYKSFADLNRDIKSNLYKLPKDISLVVGIPRSGLLAANLIANYLNLPLTDLDNFKSEHILSACYRSIEHSQNAFKGRILIVDDSVATGKAINDAKERLKEIIDSKRYKLCFCCVYAEPEKKGLVDFPLVLLERPRIFEWNFFHHKILANTCISFEGLLMKKTKVFSDNAKKNTPPSALMEPYIIPKKTINTIILECSQTNKVEIENWLINNNVLYNRLLFLNLEVGQKDKAKYKAEAYKKLKDCSLYIEESPIEAEIIHKSTGKDVYCLETNEMFSAKGYSNMLIRIKKRSKRFLNKLKIK